MRTFQPHLLLAFLFFASHVLSSASDKLSEKEDVSGLTPLHKALIEGHQGIVDDLLSKESYKSRYIKARDAKFDEFMRKLKAKVETVDDDAKKSSVDGNNPYPSST